MLKRKKSIRLRTGRTRRKGAEPIFIGPGLFGDYDGDGDAIAIVDIDGNPWPPRKRGVAEDSHDPGDDANGAREDAVPNDGDDQASAGTVRSPTGRLTPRSSRKVDRLRSGGRKIDLDDENDVLQRIRDVGARIQEPERYYLGVLVFPAGADGRVRVVPDQVVPATNASPGTSLRGSSSVSADRGASRPSQPTRKKPTRSRTRRSRGKSKFLTPDLVLVGGQKIRFVANERNPLREAERVRAEYAKMDVGRPAEVRQFLQRTYYVAAWFRQAPGDFERLQAHPFWQQSGQKPRDSSMSKWVLYFTMQATTREECDRADKYAAILDRLMRDKEEVGTD